MTIGGSLLGLIPGFGDSLAQQYDNLISQAQEKLGPLNRGENEFRGVDPGGEVGAFANRGRIGFAGRGAQANQLVRQLQARAAGEDSLSAEQLRQGLQQNVAAQQSLAAGAAPQNQALAARTAAQQSAALGSGLSGQQALAGIQERQAAQDSLGGLLQGLRQQDLEAALRSQELLEQQRGQRFGALTNTPTRAEQLGGVLQGILQLGGLGGGR